MTDWDRILKTFRKHVGMTQTELADAVGTRQSTIVRWEKGAEPRIEAFRKVADFARTKGYNLEIPWEYSERKLRLVGIATDAGPVSRQPEDPDAPGIPLIVGFAPTPVREAITIKGDKLAPRLHDGDLLGFTRSSDRIVQSVGGILIISFAETGLNILRDVDTQSNKAGWVDGATGKPLTMEWIGVPKFIVPAGGWSREPRGISK